MERVPEPLEDEHEIIRLATELKKAGDKMFKDGQWDNALNKFQAAIEKLYHLESDGTFSMFVAKIG